MADRKAYFASYYEAHQARIRKRNRSWKAKHREKVAAKNSEYKQANRERIKAVDRRCYAANKVQCNHERRKYGEHSMLLRKPRRCPNGHLFSVWPCLECAVSADLIVRQKNHRSHRAN